MKAGLPARETDGVRAFLPFFPYKRRPCRFGPVGFHVSLASAHSPPPLSHHLSITLRLSTASSDPPFTECRWLERFIDFRLGLKVVSVSTVVLRPSPVEFVSLQSCQPGSES